MRQHASRYWEQLLAGRYRRLCPTTQSAKSERERQIGRMRAMLAVVDRLTSEFPIVSRIFFTQNLDPFNANRVFIYYLKIKRDLSAVWHILTEKLEQEYQVETGESASGV